MYSVYVGVCVCVKLARAVSLKFMESVVESCVAACAVSDGGWYGVCWSYEMPANVTLLAFKTERN